MLTCGTLQKSDLICPWLTQMALFPILVTLHLWSQGQICSCLLHLWLLSAAPIQCTAVWIFCVCHWSWTFHLLFASRAYLKVLPLHHVFTLQFLKILVTHNCSTFIVVAVLSHGLWYLYTTDTFWSLTWTSVLLYYYFPPLLASLETHNRCLIKQ